jgi:hypothetical protein
MPVLNKSDCKYLNRACVLSGLSTCQRFDLSNFERSAS